MSYGKRILAETIEESGHPNKLVDYTCSFLVGLMAIGLIRMVSSVWVEFSTWIGPAWAGLGESIGNWLGV